MQTNTPTPYPDLNQILSLLAENIQEILLDNFVGLYLQGSFAIGDFDEYSDVDFIVITHIEIAEKQLNQLQLMHKEIYKHKSTWAQHLEGSYFPKDIIRSKNQIGKKAWYLDNGNDTLVKSDHCNTILVRWGLYEKGMTLVGTPIKTLIDKVTTEELRKDIFSTINEWGEEILSNPNKFDNHFYQTFIVLSYCRMLHDLIQGTNNSKRIGAKWTKENLNPKWHDLIDKSWDGRPNPETTSKQKANPEDFSRTLEFVEYIIEKSKEYYLTKES